MHEWYADGVEPTSLLLGASMTKSALAHLVGLAVRSGQLRSRTPSPTTSRSWPGRVRRVHGGAGAHDDHGTPWVEDHRDPAGPATRLIASFAGAGADSRALLTRVEAEDPPGTRWRYSTADSQVLDWVRERATGTSYVEAMGSCGGGWAACVTPWSRWTPRESPWPEADWLPAPRTGPGWRPCSSTASPTASGCSASTGWRLLAPLASVHRARPAAQRHHHARRFRLPLVAAHRRRESG